MKDLYTVRSQFLHRRPPAPSGERMRAVNADLQFLEEIVRLCLLRILNNEPLRTKFCNVSQGLDDYLDEMVLPPH